MSIQLDLEHGLWHYVALSCSSKDSCFYCHLNPFEIYNDQIISSRIILESQISSFPQQNCSIWFRTKRQPAGGHGTRSTSPCPWDG